MAVTSEKLSRDKPGGGSPLAADYTHTKAALTLFIGIIEPKQRQRPSDYLIYYWTVTIYKHTKLLQTRSGRDDRDGPISICQRQEQS
jgi:hypothetical protein